MGRVVDSQQGNPIAGAQVEVIGTTLTTTTALDGRYAVTGVPAGPTSVRVRMIGFAPKLVTGVVVPSGGSVNQDIALSASAVQLAEIAVTAEAERGTVNRALDEQRNAVNIVNSVSAEQISKSPDSDAGQAIQRVSGVTVQDGKYIFVRGLGERYTTTTLNGSRIPSPEPERKVVPLDMFPSGLLENITTSKTVHAGAAGRLQRGRGKPQDSGVPGPAGHDLHGVGRMEQRGHGQVRCPASDCGPGVAGLCRERTPAARAGARRR